MNFGINRLSFSWLIVVAAFATASATAVPAGFGKNSPSKVTIQFRDHATVSGDMIKLGDIARIIAGEEHAVAELESLQVAKSAAFGLTRMLDTETLYNRFLLPLSHRLAIEFDHKTIRISTASAKLPMDSLSHLINNFVASLPSHSGEVRHWETVRAPKEILVPVSPHTLEVVFAGAKHKGKVDLTVSIRTAERVLRNIPLTINLRVEEPVLVAKKHIERGTPLDNQNVAIEMRETTQMNEMTLGNPKKLLGFLAKVTINPGRIITPRVVAMPPIVKRGQAAKILYRNGGVSVTADAVCRQDGLPGQIITAKSLVSQRLIRVRVTEDGWLEPIPGG